MKEKLEDRIKHGVPESFMREENFRKSPGISFCTGCGHGLVNKKIGEAIDELGIADRCVLVAPVGCAVFDYEYYNFDTIQAPHGRALAFATGIKASNPNLIVMTKQGDGDEISIGAAETLHTPNRNPSICNFFINNAIYGMTGGQMAATTLIGQKTTTSPGGKKHSDGSPIRVCELLDTLGVYEDDKGKKIYDGGPTYIERVSVYDAHRVRKMEQAIRKALRIQMKGQGFSLVEILSPCPSGWKMNTYDANNYVRDEMAKIYPIRRFRDLEDKR